MAPPVSLCRPPAARFLIRTPFVALALALVGAVPPVRAYEAISLEPFSDSIGHWQKLHDLTDYPRYAPDQISDIAANMILCQRSNGGWHENQDPARILSDEEKATFAAEKGKLDTTLDNRTSYTHVDYLVAVYAQTHDAAHRDACLRGVGYLLAAQDPSGGWPHSWPARDEAYPSHLTFADDVIPGVLRTLRRCASGVAPYDIVPEDLREKCTAAVKRGDAFILEVQVRQPGGQLAAWAGQYDEHTLKPAQGRAFEMPSVVSEESVTVVRYLMSMRDPTPGQIAAIEGAVSWFDRVQLRGLRLEQFPAEPIRYKYHTSRFDRRIVADPEAPPLWARFYDLADNSVVLANRDSRRVTSLDQIERERRTGYTWYGTWPADLLAHDYPEWCKRMGRKSVLPEPRDIKP